MKREGGDWVRFRQLPNLLEHDFHRGRRDPSKAYWDAMAEVRDEVLSVLRKAQAEGFAYVLFTHGSSTSRPGQTTARSQIRGLMRSKDATPYIDRPRCIQHHSVFVAAIKPTT